MTVGIILFDGVCNLCNKSVLFVIKHDKYNQFKFASLQSNFGQNYLKKNNLYHENFDSIIFIQENRYYTKSTAALRIAKYLDKKISWISILLIIPKSIRDIFYNIISKNRYKFFGKQDSCLIPTDELKFKFLD